MKRSRTRVSRCRERTGDVESDENEAEEEEEKRPKKNERMAHNLAFPRDADYINRLHDWSERAEGSDGVDDDVGEGGGGGQRGRGKRAPRWGPRERWLRERFPLIKAASRALGEGRRDEVTTLEELGFVYEGGDDEGEREQGR